MEEGVADLLNSSLWVDSEESGILWRRGFERKIEF